MNVDVKIEDEVAVVAENCNAKNNDKINNMNEYIVENNDDNNNDEISRVREMTSTTTSFRPIRLNTRPCRQRWSPEKYIENKGKLKRLPWTG